MRTRRLFASLVFLAAVSAAEPAFALASDAAAAWPQYQGDEARTGFATEAPVLPYRTVWSAPSGIGDTTHISGIPAPILTGSLAIVVGREEVTAVDLATGDAAWTAPRALGPSAPAAVAGDLLLFLEGGGDESASASSTPSASGASSGASATSSPAPTPSKGGTAAPSASAPPSTTAATSTLVAIDLATRDRAWTVPLTEVSHTGVLLIGRTAIVGTDDGKITAIEAATGTQTWSVDVGDHVLATMAGTDELVLASVRPEAQGSASLVALHASDGTEVWRYRPSGTVLDLGAPSVGGDLAYFVASDGSVRAVGVADGSQRWASQLYTPTAGSPPAVSAAGVFVTDQSGTVYAFDPVSGAERWRFASNRFAIGGPIATADAVLQPASDGTILAIGVATGHQVWHATVADAAVVGLAATADLIVATHTGTTPGFVALGTDPAGPTEDITSPTTADPGGLLLAWFAAALPIVAALVLLGRALERRMGTPDLGTADDDVVDPWEAELEDET